MTRALISLVRDKLGHGMLYDARYSQTTFSGAEMARDMALMGVSLKQPCVDWVIDQRKLLLRVDEVSEDVLAPIATMLVEKLQSEKGIITFDLMLPTKGVIESCRHVFDGIAMRCMVANLAATDNPVMRWDILVGSCNYETLKKIAA